MKDGSSKNEPQSTSVQRATVFVAIITMFATPFNVSAATIAIPSISAQFHSSMALIGWIFTGYMLSTVCLSVPAGRIADLTGRKRILLIGLLIFTLAAGACAFSWSVASMVGFRVLQGIGASMIFGTNTAILIDAFPPEKRGKVLGYAVAATYIGLSAGPVAGGLLNQYLGWHSIFIFTSLLGIAPFVLALKMLPGDAGSSRVAARDRSRFDILGNIFYVGTTLCVMFGLSAFSDIFFAKFLIPVGLGLGVLFVFHELKAKSPIIEIRLFSGNMNYTLSNLATLLNYGATFALSYFMSIFLQVILGYGSQTAGLILITQPLTMAVVSPWAGRLSDRVSPFKIATAGMAVCAAGLLSFAFISTSYSLVHILVNLLVIGIGFGFFSSPNTNAVMSCVTAKDYGVASSFLSTMRTTGHTTSMAVVTFIVTLRMGDAAFADVSPELLVSTLRTGFMVFTAFCVVGIALSMQRKTNQ